MDPETQASIINQAAVVRFMAFVLASNAYSIKENDIPASLMDFRGLRFPGW
jgi:hypothetical protein